MIYLVEIRTLTMSIVMLPNFPERICIRALVASIILIFSQVVEAQSISFRRDESDFVRLPGDEPSSLARIVTFADAVSWFASNKDKIEISDFESTEVVYFEHRMTREMSEFVAGFPKLEQVIVMELPVEVDLGALLLPLSSSKTLRSLEINMVNVDHRDCTFLEKFEQLTDLAIDVFLSEKDMAAIQKLQNLRSLSVNTPNEPPVKPIMLSQLRTLTLFGPNDIVWFDSNMNIETLKIWFRCSQKDVINITKFSALKNLDLRLESMELLHQLAQLDLETLHVVIDK